jgi:ABC-type multidrug transport system fused ATPase/permease subunit
MHQDTKNQLADALCLQVGSHLLEHCIFGLLRDEGRTVVMATHQLHSLSRCDHVILLDSGQIVANGTPADVSMSDHEFGPLLAEVLDVSPSLKSASSGTDSPGEEQDQMDEKDRPEAAGKPGSTLVSTEDRRSGSVGWPTYRAYIIAGGGAYFALLVCVVSAACQAARIGADVWLAIWAEGVDSNTEKSESLSSLDLSPAGYVAVYALLTAIVIPLNIGRTFGFVLGTVRSSRTLHNSMFGHVAKAPLVFFEENPLGRILNRFANDMDALDTMMPWSALAAFQIAFTAFGAVFASVAALPAVVVVLPPLFAVFLRIQKLYLSTSREVKRIESVNKSPVYATFSVALPGLACIRAARLQDHFRELFVGSLDRFHRPHYLFLTGSRWVGIRLDALSNALVLTVACAVVWLRGAISPALAGVVLTQSMQLTGVLQ